MSTSSTRPHVTENDYSSSAIRFSGARKLADSGVAPLVAQARGYYTIDTIDAALHLASTHSKPSTASANSSMIRRAIEGGGDVLSMPWFRLDQVARHGINAEVGSMQIRPSKPLINPADGKKRKYSSLAGAASIIDVHPATPTDWVSDPQKVLFTEGLLKADSALSAQLIAHGFSLTDLAWNDDLTTHQAREKLSQMMQQIPVRARVTILGLIGVGNWRKNPEWNAVDFRDKKVYVAFDGDVNTNPQVYRQAQGSFEFVEYKGGTPLLLNLGSETAEFAAEAAGYYETHDRADKVGVDDYLSHIGTWEDLFSLADDGLPPAPYREEAEAQEGDFRVSEEGTHTVKLVKQGDGTELWITAIGIGGRIKRASDRIYPSDPSMENSILEPGLIEPDGNEGAIELCWEDPITGEVITRTVTGPAELQSMLPTDWKGDKIHVPVDVFSHPEWPPRGRDAEKWLTAIKMHRRTNISSEQRWSAMGWVPAGTLEDDSPAFIINSGTLARTEEREQLNASGVDATMISRASSFGVRDRYRELAVNGHLDAYKAHVRDVFNTTVSAFLTRGPWREKVPANGAILLAAALRPTIPGRPETVLYIHGEPHSGKSWAASFLLAFWQKEPGQWNEKRLTGTAQDTPTSTERFIARTPIWVSDDLAPTVSRQESERQEKGIDNLIRMAFNGTGKGRGSGSGGVQQTLSPRALLVLTAENERTGKSITERVVQMGLSVGDTDGAAGEYIRDLSNDPTQPLSALTATMIRFWLNEPGDHLTPEMLQVLDPKTAEKVKDLDLRTWMGKRALVRTIINDSRSSMQRELEKTYGQPVSSSARPSALYGELAAVFDVLAMLGAWAGVDLSSPEMRSIMRMRNNSPAQMLTERANSDIERGKKRTNAKQLIAAIKAMFEGGQAHLANAIESGKPPFPPEMEGSEAMNVAVGWVRNARNDATWEPRGREIGIAGLPPQAPEDGEWVALMNSTNAFKEAQRNHPELIPYGQTAAATWQQVWSSDDGAMINPHVSRQPGKLQGRVQFTGGQRLRGVPLKASLFFD